MVGVQVRTSHRSVFIVGHGLVVDAPFQLTDEITVQPDPPKLTADEAASLCAGFADYAAVITGMDLATFCLQVHIDEGGRDLAILSWNALWIFHLLSVAARSPCFSLYTVSGTDNRICSAANRSSFIRALPTTPTIGEASLAWARDHLAAFDTLVGNQQFRAAMLCYGNAHYLPDIDVRVMLLWAGIEGLLSVDAELNRRLALYAALLLDGTPEEKARHFDRVKKAYGFRSRVVHGARLDPQKMSEGYATSAQILIGLLFRCVELGRVPTPDELDRAAVANTIS